MLKERRSRNKSLTVFGINFSDPCTRWLNVTMPLDPKAPPPTFTEYCVGLTV